MNGNKGGNKGRKKSMVCHKVVIINYIVFKNLLTRLDKSSTDLLALEYFLKNSFHFMY